MVLDFGAYHFMPQVVVVLIQELHFQESSGANCQMQLQDSLLCCIV